MPKEKEPQVQPEEPPQPVAPPPSPRPKRPFIPPPIITEPDKAVRELWTPPLPFVDRDKVS